MNQYKLSPITIDMEMLANLSNGHKLVEHGLRCSLGHCMRLQSTLLLLINWDFHKEPFQ